MKNGVKQLSLLSLIGLSLTNVAWAEVARPKNDTLTNTIQSAELKTSSFSSMPKKEIPNRHIISLSKSQLAQHPRLVLRGLIPALYQNNTQAVQLLLPLYKQFPQQTQNHYRRRAHRKPRPRHRRQDYRPAQRHQHHGHGRSHDHPQHPNARPLPRHRLPV